MIDPDKACKSRQEEQQLCGCSCMHGSQTALRLAARTHRLSAARARLGRSLNCMLRSMIVRMTDADAVESFAPLLHAPSRSCLFVLRSCSCMPVVVFCPKVCDCLRAAVDLSGAWVKGISVCI